MRILVACGFLGQSSNPVSRSSKIKDLADRVKSFFVALMTVASVFASVWQKIHPEKVCVILNIFENLKTAAKAVLRGPYL